MNSFRSISFSPFLFFVFFFFGCGDDVGTSNDTDSATENECIPAENSVEIVEEWPNALSTHNGEIGDSCRIMEDCNSNYCESFQDSPPDPDATCQTASDLGYIRITGNLRDFETKKPLSGVPVDIIGGPGMAQDPTGDAIVTLTTNDSGRYEYDGGSEVTRKQVAIGARVNLAEQGYVLSATGLVRTEIDGEFYPPGVRGHDIYAVPKSLVDNWNSMLQQDPCVTFFLPLVEKGGAFGRLQDADTGNPPEKPLLLISQDPDSTSIVRYLNDDGTAFVDTQSNTTNGFFVILSNQEMEKFDAYRDGVRLNKFSCIVGKAFNGAGVVYINVDIDEW